MTDSTTTASDASAAVLLHLDPHTLLLDRNIREATVDKVLVDSIREHGVITPVVALFTEDGDVRVRDGHRRTLGAIEAGRATVPVYAHPYGTPDDVLDRLPQQWATNEHREGLSGSEKIGAVSQLTLLGLNAGQVAQRLHAPKAEVAAAVKAGKSDLATKASERYAFLTLDQAATLAEFDGKGDEDTAKALVAAAQADPGQFEHVAAKARQAKVDAKRRRALARQISATGVKVLDGEMPYDTSKTTARRLDYLVTPEGEPITPGSHAECPGHAAFLASANDRWTDEEAATVLLWTPPVPVVEGEAPEPASPVEVDDFFDEDDPDAYDDLDDLDGDAEASSEGEGQDPQEATRRFRPRPAALYVCTDAAAHGHRDRYASRYDTRPLPAAEPQDDEARAAAEAARKEADSAARREVIANNKAWTAATSVRIGHLRKVLQAKKAPKGAAVFVAESLMQGSHAIRRGMERSDVLTLLWDLTGHDLIGAPRRSVRIERLLPAADDARAQVLSLGVVLLSYEDATGKDSWRHTDRDTSRYLRFLEANGYTLSDVERLACGEQALPEADQPTEAAPVQPVDLTEADTTPQAQPDGEGEDGPDQAAPAEDDDEDPEVAAAA